MGESSARLSHPVESSVKSSRNSAMVLVVDVKDSGKFKLDRKTFCSTVFTAGGEWPLGDGRLRQFHHPPVQPLYLLSFPG